MRATKITSFLLAAILWSASPAFAGALLRITPTGVTVSEQDATGQTSPVPIDGDGFRLTYHSEGNTGDDIVDPLVLILATPLGLSGAPSLTWSTGDPYSPPATPTNNVDVDFGYKESDPYNQTNAGGNGTQSVYSFLGLNYGNSSEKWVNWNTASGVAAWDLWVYYITFTPDLERGDWVEFATSLPVGSFVVGYGCTDGVLDYTTGCEAKGDTQSTPFTFSGMVVKTPEPTSVFLLSFGLVMLAGVRGRSRRTR
jgi:hypothetical protein